MEDIGLNTFCVGIALIIVGIQLGPLFVIFSLTAISIGGFCIHLIPIVWRLVVQYPELGVAARVICVTAIVVWIYKGNRRDGRTSMNKVKIQLETMASLEKECKQLQDNVNAERIKREALETKLDLTNLTLRDVQLSFEQSEPSQCSQIANLQATNIKVRNKQQHYKTAFDLSVQDYISLQKGHEKLKIDYANLYDKYTSLNQDLSVMNKNVRNECERFKMLKQDIIATKADMDKVLLCFNDDDRISASSTQMEECEYSSTLVKVYGES